MISKCILQIAIHEWWSHVQIERDAKRCFDALSANDVPPDWSICNIISRILSLKIYFVSIFSVESKETAML